MNYIVTTDNLDLMHDLVEYLQLDYKTLLLRLSLGNYFVQNEWINKKSEEDFYKTSKGYIYDLAMWHLAVRRNIDYQINDKAQNCKKLLDYGCGIGENAIMAARYLKLKEIVIADFPCPSLEFAKWRIKKHNYPIKVWEIGVNDKQFINKKFDLIYCLDVLEHLNDIELERVVNLLLKMKTNNIISIVSQKDDTHPMHYKMTPKRKKLIGKLYK